MPSEIEKSTSAPSDELEDARIDENDREESDGIALPAHVAGSGNLDRLVEDIRSDLPEKERLTLFSGHSLRAGLASSATPPPR